MLNAAGDWDDILRDQAGEYARLALANISREFPTLLWHLMRDAGDLPGRPRERTPVFYGSLDWHSGVEMHWLLVRLLRLAAGAGVPGGAAGLAAVVPAVSIRAWCWRRIAASLLPGDPRIGPVLAAARVHAAAALPYVVGSDYMVKHWLAAYAVLLLT